MRKTKIICTLGPATEDLAEELIEYGMDAARVNFSHETYEIHAERIRNLKQARKKYDKPVPIIMDTRGPEIRTGKMKEEVWLQQGQQFILTAQEVVGDKNQVHINPPHLIKKLQPGTDIFIDDGKIKLSIKEAVNDRLICQVETGGYLSDKKGVNIPGLNFGIPCITETDRKDIEFALNLGIDYVAVSFVKNSGEINKLKKFLKSRDHSDVKVIAKIENREAVQNIDHIIEAADGLMVARGDLGVELPLSEVPGIQKKIIRKCNQLGKPVITATQMLESMNKNSIPTRAEASDVANAVYDGTDVVMLSGETAAGQYPIKSLQTLVDILLKTEQEIDYEKEYYNKDWGDFEKEVVNIIGKTATTAAYEISARAITVSTKSGNTARMIARFRPDTPIIAVTIDPRITRQLNLSWGVFPVEAEFVSELESLLSKLIECTQATSLVDQGDPVVIIAGIPTGLTGKTNMLKIHNMGDPIVNSSET